MSRSASPVAAAPAGVPRIGRIDADVIERTPSRIVLLTWGPEWFDGGEVNPWPERVYTNGIYDPATDMLDGHMVIRARALQNLSRFDLDLQQLDVSAVRSLMGRIEMAVDDFVVRRNDGAALSDGE
jgi:hypothetical protein